MVHGVGRHTPLSSLLQVYQAFRSNLLSREAPSNFEDRIPDWELEDVEEGEAPPYLKLIPRFPDQSGGVKAVYLYEVNYSTMAGLIRRNQPLDLTTLFVGLDMAVCASRLKLAAGMNSPLSDGDPRRLARRLQQVTAVLTAATVPILGVPSLIFKNYTETFVAAFTRFFEDVATFALDKNGEKLISAHLDRTVENIVKSERFTRSDAPGTLVIAAHSLGTVVAHNLVVRHWADKPGCVPERLVTFGSPIGFISWLWLFLDFTSFDFTLHHPNYRNFFCWNVTDNSGKAAKPLHWINVVNCLDPIATAFPTQAADLSLPLSNVGTNVRGGIVQKFFGAAKLTATGASHTQYLNDRGGFVEILMRAAELRPGKPEDVAGTDPATHWTSTCATLGRLKRYLGIAAAILAAAYCGLVAAKLENLLPLAVFPFLVWPPLTIGGVAFFQRFFFGGPTKRIDGPLIGGFSWRDGASIPYLIRRRWDRLRGAPDDVAPDAPAQTVWRFILQMTSFIPTLAIMAAPVLAGGWSLQTGSGLGSSLRWFAVGLVVFSMYLIACAGYLLVGGWRDILMELGVGSKPAPVAASNAAAP